MHLLPAEAGLGDPPAATVKRAEDWTPPPRCRHSGKEHWDPIDRDVEPASVRADRQALERGGKRQPEAEPAGPLLHRGNDLRALDVCALVEVRTASRRCGLLLRALSRGEVGKCTGGLSERSPRGGHPSPRGDVARSPGGRWSESRPVARISRLQVTSSTTMIAAARVRAGGQPQSTTGTGSGTARPRAAPPDGRALRLRDDEAGRGR